MSDTDIELDIGTRIAQSGHDTGEAHHCLTIVRQKPDKTYCQ